LANQSVEVIVIHWQPPITVVMRVTWWFKAHHKQLFHKKS